MRPTTLLTLLLPLITAAPVRQPTGFARDSINDILALISEWFPLGETLAVAGAAIAAGDQLLADALGFSTTQSDLLDGNCGDVVIVFARGTDEPGNVGALVGPPLFNALSSALGGRSLSVQGVGDYGASVTEFLEGGDPVGSTEM